MHGNPPHIFFDSKLKAIRYRNHATLFGFMRKPLFSMSLTKTYTHTQETNVKMENGEVHFDLASHLAMRLLFF